ncbi:MAG: hypothetical protein IBX61_08050 [Thermoleophilia bacterium]|nr:hypothetical protein [Thermoleophilia bacterium]
MESTAKPIGYKEQEGTQAALAEVTEKEASEMSEQMTSTEKVTFGIAAIFSTSVLIILFGLTIVGFIFSPVTDTLIFALLTLATGVTSYVVWRGGRRHAG